MEGLTEQEYAPELVTQVRARNDAVNVLDNLTLMTQALNSTVSNGPFAIKVPAIKANAALALNRELGAFNHWDENAIHKRGEALFEVSRGIWAPPQRAEIEDAGNDIAAGWTPLPTPFPTDGTKCRFTYSGKEYLGEITNGGALIVEGVDGKHTSFSAASKAVTGTSRNGWNDWYLNLEGKEWVVANEWRKDLVLS